MNPRAILAEDEPLLAQGMQAALKRAWPELSIVGIAPNGLDALALIERERPDVAFLDIRMPGLTGLEVAGELAERLDPDARAPLLVFVTAYDEFALKAFELAAIDYLLKPVDPARLERCVARLQSQLATPEGDMAALALRLGRLIAAPTAAPQAVLKHIRAGSGNTVRMVPVDEVSVFRSDEKYTAVLTADAEYLIRTPLKELLLQLPAERFRQVHRSAVVNLDHVESALRDEAGRVSLKMRGRAETVAVSRVFAEQFRQM
ncbi:MAG: response regulator transcription factor [Burkholderiales bacterium]|nr:response regulator transcription factor [Burkholderiales bacterium]